MIEKESGDIFVPQFYVICLTISYKIHSYLLLTCGVNNCLFLGTFLGSSKLFDRLFLGVAEELLMASLGVEGISSLSMTLSVFFFSFLFLFVP